MEDFFMLYSRNFKTTRTTTLDYNVLGGLLGIFPGYSYKEG
jgi:hypothetical protein